MAMLCMTNTMTDENVLLFSPGLSPAQFDYTKTSYEFFYITLRSLLCEKWKKVVDENMWEN